MSVIKKALDKSKGYKKLRTSAEREEEMRIVEKSLGEKGLLPKMKFSHFGDLHKNK